MASSATVMLARGLPSDDHPLRRLREERQLSLADVAALAHCTKQLVHRAERGLPVELGTLVKLAVALGVKLEQIAPAEAAVVARVM